jgi:hypothetical protein
VPAPETAIVPLEVNGELATVKAVGIVRPTEFIEVPGGFTGVVVQPTSTPGLLGDTPVLTFLAEKNLPGTSAILTSYLV